MNGQLPDPAFVTVVSADGTQWRRGIHYAYGGGDGTQVYIDVAFSGVLSVCPSLQGMTGSRMQWGPDTYCNYTLGTISDS
jgi:hypothetical protein